MNSNPNSSTTYTSSQACAAHRVQCRMQAEEVAMERLLQVVRIRGFRLQDLQVEREGDGFHIALTVAGERPIDFLLRQLEKLHTILSVMATPVGGNQGRSEAALKSA